MPEQIEAILARPAVANNSWTIIVENETGSLRYYQKSPTTGRAPASNVKMFTTAAAIGLLGTNHVFESRVYLDGSFSNGTLVGNVNLVSEHDITWNTSTFSGNARRALDFIAGKLKTNGLNAVTGNVQCFGVCYYNRSSTSTSHNSESASSHNGSAATAFLAALQAQGITVTGTAAGQSGFTPPGNLFYTYHSTNLTYGGQPLRLDVACIPLMRVSHNVMADQLLRHIGYKLSGTDSFSAGRSRVLPWLQNTAGVSTNGIVMNDGSGLSWNNRFSAQQMISLTRYMLGAHPSWRSTLPVGCASGTLGSRFCGTDGEDQVHAKTGSLSVSIALSGYIDNSYNNQRYLFSFVGYDSGADIDQTATRDAIDDCVVLFGARGAPTGPEILAVTNRGNGTALNITWANQDLLRTSYRIYSSDNGSNYTSLAVVGTNVHSYTHSGLTPGTKKYYRVGVQGSGGESAPSRGYGAQVGTNRSRVLIVDGNDRWQVFPSKNPTAASHQFATIIGQSISGPPFDTASHGSVLSGSISLTNYDAVVWMLGEESTLDESLSSTEQTIVGDYLAAGGNLFISGSELGWDLDRDTGPLASDRTFYRNQLRATLNGNANDDANTYSFAPTGGGIFAGNTSSGFDNGSFGTFEVTFPDVLTPTNGSVSAISYVGGRGGVAAVTYDNGSGGGRIVNFGFPFETITNAVARQAYMSDVLRFFDVLEPPQLSALQLDLIRNEIGFSWNASAGLRYRIQVKTNLTQTNWSQLFDVTATGTTGRATNAIGGGQRFYRVTLLD